MKIALLSSTRLQPGKQQLEAGCGQEGPPAVELLGCSDPDVLTASISHLMSLTPKPLLGTLWKLLCAATALHANVAK